MHVCVHCFCLRDDSMVAYKLKPLWDIIFFAAVIQQSYHLQKQRFETEDVSLDSHSVLFETCKH